MQARDELWSAGQVADYLRCTRQNVAYLRWKGQLAATQVRSGWLFKRNLVEQYSRQRQRRHETREMATAS